MRRGRNPIYCLEPLPAEMTRAVEVRICEVVAGQATQRRWLLPPGMELTWRCYVIIPPAWLGNRRASLLLKLATAIGQLYGARRRDMRAGGLPSPRLTSARFRVLSRRELARRPWLRAPCYAITPAIEPYALDPASVQPLLDLDLAA